MLFLKKQSFTDVLQKSLVIKYTTSQNYPKPPKLKASQNQPKPPTAGQNHPQQPKLSKTNKRHPLSKLIPNKKPQ